MHRCGVSSRRSTSASWRRCWHMRSGGGDLLQRYSAGTVAPFALLAPAVGLGMSSLVYGESFSITRLAGMALLLIGVAVTAGLLNRSPGSGAASVGVKR
ncbi:EamA family transporter [Variovorax paradoxus]|uniref:EamA family transporter n=2 Tax=Variovorax paradoxus TaxID=34073 RepID=UPI003990EF2C